MRYLVRRHSGLSTGAFRTVLDTDSEAAARARFASLSTALRRGTVVLIDTAEDTTLQRSGAPRTRTRR